MRKFCWILLWLTALIPGLPQNTKAADICTATALRNIPDTSGTYTLKKGQIDGAITQYIVDKVTGDTSFCSHGGGCYPTHVVQSGNKLEALKLNNCEIDKSSADEDASTIVYSLKPIRSKISKNDLQHDDLENRLSDLGLCGACASNVASIYLKDPKSACGTLTKSALEGDPDALTELQSFPQYCHDGW